MVTNEQNPVDRPILFYDGECGLCARSVRWCLDHDRAGRLMFAPLQGSTYKGLQNNISTDMASEANNVLPADLSTVVFYCDGAVYFRSDAALRAMLTLGGVWRVVGRAGLCVPRSVRNVIYNYIAKRRIAWFGDAASCSIPSKEEARRFLS